MCIREAVALTVGSLRFSKGLPLLRYQMDPYIFRFKRSQGRFEGRGGGVGMGVSGMVSVGLVLGCIEAKFCK